MLSDIVHSAKPDRVDLRYRMNTESDTNENEEIEVTLYEDGYHTPDCPVMEITDKFQSVLKEIFARYASNDDGTMSTKDFQRYVLSVGAGQASASMDRVRNVFSSFQSFGTESLGLDGFGRFYNVACGDRLNYVWSDILT